jgi:hypothetical protein
VAAAKAKAIAQPAGKKKAVELNAVRRRSTASGKTTN